ncbi:hypothetical protein F4780DRAFT_792122 [Xylariomycetidae sp. FL0641]|nr:hypothetical protein F4780DRAFT_792122 [Xylariomycetidae sp. FL0641]
MLGQFSTAARQNFLACVVLLSLSLCALALRFSVRRYRLQRPQPADWMCLVSNIFFAAQCGLILDFIFNGAERRDLDDDFSLGKTENRRLGKTLFACELLFALGITSIKLSILWFYHALFSANPTTMIAIKCTAIVCIIWFLVVIFVVIFQCHPVAAYWELGDVPPQCLEYPRVFFGNELTNLFLDIAILCIPVFIIPQLKLPTAKKAHVLAMFLLGVLVCVCSIVRITAIWKPPNIFLEFDYPNMVLWSTLQLGLANITSCLPTYGPLLPLFGKPFPLFRIWYASMKQRFSSARSENWRSETLSARVGEPWHRLAEDRPGAATMTTAYRYENGSLEFGLEPIVPSRIVLVERSVEIV